MSFLAPFYLLLAGAAAVPLLLHLLRRNVGDRVEFPAARYLQRAEREHSKALRLRNLLLMLLRVLLLVLLALAAARPFVRGVGTGHGATAVAIVLDNSLSTTAVSAGVPAFNRLRDGARAVLLAATPADRLWLVTADGALRTGTREALLGELARVTPMEDAGDLALAFRRADAAVRGASLPARGIVVATDGQRTAWTSARRTPDGVIVLAPDEPPPSNRAVLDVAVQPARWTPRGAVIARVAVPDSAGYRITLGNRTAARGIAVRDEPLSVRLSPPERGWQAGAVELEPDDFPADDARHFAVWIGAPPVASAAASAGPFVSTALAALVADGRASAGAGITITSADAATGLPALLLAPSDPLRIGAANRTLARFNIPWRFGTVVTAPASAHGAGLDGVSVSRRYRLERQGVPTRSDTLASAGADAWAVAGPGYVLIASPMDPIATDLPLRAAFLPWLSQALGQRLGAPLGDVGAPIVSTPRAPLVLPAGVDAIESASGARRSITGERVEAPPERGVWFLLQAGRRVGAVVVEAPDAESDLRRWRPGDLAARLGGANARGVTSPDALAHAAYATGARHPFTTPLLVLAFLLLAAETAVVRANRPVAA